jgi:hypothetical protein
MEDRALASRSQVKVANIRWLSEASLGIRERQASKVSPWVPEDTRLGPVLGFSMGPFDGNELPGPVPGVAPVCRSAHPINKTAKLKEAQRNTVEKGFMGSSSFSRDKQVGEYT